MSNADNGFEQPKGSGTDNAPYVNGSLVGTQLAFAIAAGGVNVSEITISLTDGHGAAITNAPSMNIWLSDAATGIGLTATSASGTVQAKAASGADFAALTAKKALVVQPLATGAYTLEITDTAKTGFYVAAQCPFSGEVFVSRQLVTADYG